MLCLRNDLILLYSLPGIHSPSNSALAQCVVVITVNIHLALSMYYPKYFTLFNLPGNHMTFYYHSYFPVEEIESTLLSSY